MSGAVSPAAFPSRLRALADATQARTRSPSDTPDGDPTGRTPGVGQPTRSGRPPVRRTVVSAMAAPPQHRATNAGRPLTVATNPFALFGSVALGGDRVDASSSRDPLGGAGHALRRGRDGWPHDRRHGQGRRLHHALGQHRVLVRARRRAPGLHALRRPDGVVGAPPQRPADCDNDWGGAITLEVRAAFGCVGDTVAGLAGARRAGSQVVAPAASGPGRDDGGRPKRP
jgi:hypothetical protein